MCRSSGEGRTWALHPAPGSRHYRVRVDASPAAGRSLAQYEVVSAPAGSTHLMFRSKLQLAQFLFSGTARRLGRLQLEAEDITVSGAEAAEEVGEGVKVRVSRELAMHDPGLSPLPHLVRLTPGGLLPVAAVEEEVTGGRAVTGVRYRRPGVRSSEWRSCVREGGVILPPPGGWDAAADFVVFAERKEQGKADINMNKDEGSQVVEVEQLQRKVVELERRLVEEREAREELASKVTKLELVLKDHRGRVEEREEGGEARKGRTSPRALRRRGRRSSSRQEAACRGGECEQARDGRRTRGRLNSDRSPLPRVFLAQPI